MYPLSEPGDIFRVHLCIESVIQTHLKLRLKIPIGKFFVRKPHNINSTYSIYYLRTVSKGIKLGNRSRRELTLSSSIKFIPFFLW